MTGPRSQTLRMGKKGRKTTETGSGGGEEAVRGSGRQAVVRVPGPILCSPQPPACFSASSSFT